MDPRITEASYPASFRHADAHKLGEYIMQRESVSLVGMRRVGISNFLRFFINHKAVSAQYLKTDEKHVFIPVDLNDLVEREIYPFWTLVMKRIVDASEDMEVPDRVKEKINTYFLNSIQTQDTFLLIDNIRRSLMLITENEIYPTLFFLRFDRLTDAFNSSFFDNLEGLRAATYDRANYVFTSYRSVDALFPEVKNRLSVFAHVMHISPAKEEDIAVIYHTYKKRFNLNLSDTLEKALFRLVNGNVQYLQLASVILNEKREQSISSEQALLELLLTDERIKLESDELWESLRKEEQSVILSIAKGEPVSPEERLQAKYLWDTGFIISDGNTERVFSPLLAHYLLRKENDDKRSQLTDLTRKEHLLFNLLKSRLGVICEREKIIEVVWPEYQEFDVSDWAIDRLVARVRVKLRRQNSPYEIVTVRTRGYKLSIANE